MASSSKYALFLSALLVLLLSGAASAADQSDPKEFRFPRISFRDLLPYPLDRFIPAGLELNIPPAKLVDTDGHPLGFEIPPISFINVFGDAAAVAPPPPPASDGSSINNTGAGVTTLHVEIHKNVNASKLVKVDGHVKPAAGEVKRRDDDETGQDQEEAPRQHHPPRHPPRHPHGRPAPPAPKHGNKTPPAPAPAHTVGDARRKKNPSDKAIFIAVGVSIAVVVVVGCAALGLFCFYRRRRRGDGDGGSGCPNGDGVFRFAEFVEAEERVVYRPQC